MRAVLCMVAGAFVAPVYALPTMVRLGYPNCVSCHVSPQGGGMLNEYGRGIDEAQSRRAGEYERTPAGKWEPFTLGGRIDQDFRVVLSEAITRQPGGDVSGTFRPRFYYRNVTSLGKGFRLTLTAAGESQPSPRKWLAYDPAPVPGEAYLPGLLVQYRPKDGVEIAVGRDQLPMGVYTGDLGTLVKSRNRWGLYDAPLQAKVFLWTKRWQVVPYAFVPGGLGSGQAREKGGGVLAEYDVLGKGKTIVGVNMLRGVETAGSRSMAGIYTRLGFGKWGVFAEHDFTRRRYLPVQGIERFGQGTTYVQGFRAFREWLVGSLIYERLEVESPFRERLLAGRGELSARLTPNFTLAVRAGMQFDRISGRAAPTVSLGLAWKTVGMRPW